MAHGYVWNGGSGRWANRGNWNDLTIPQNPAPVSPGAGDVVSLAAAPGGQFTVLAGPGAAAGFSYNGNLALTGSFALDAVSSIARTDTLDILAGSSVTVNGAALGNVFIAGPGAGMDVAGTISVGADLTLSDHASLSANGLIASGSGTLRVSPTATISLASGLFLGADQTLAVAGVMELGGAGGATAGTLTIDAGQTAFLAGTVRSPIHVDGVVQQLGGTVVAISGSGTVETTSVVFAGPVAAGITVVMAVPAASITLPATGFAGVVAGLAAGPAGSGIADVLRVPRSDIVDASYAPGQGGLGTLVLTGAEGATLASVTLAGSYDPAAFLAVPGSVFGDGDTVVVVANTIVTGATIGDATWTGVAAMSGVNAFGSLTVATASLVELAGGGTIAATGISISGGALVAHGAGALLADGGALRIGDGSPANAGLGLFDGAGGSTPADLQLAGANARIVIDAASSFLVGTGAATVGALTVDQPRQVAGSGTIEARIVNNGSLIAGASDALVIAGDLSGIGEAQIGAQATLALRGDVSPGQTIEFTGAGGTLDLRAAGNVLAPITGFVAGDVILAPASVARVSYDGGTMTMSDLGGTTVAAIAISGSFAGNALLVRPFTAAGGTEVRLALGTLQSAPIAPADLAVAGQVLVWAGGGGDWGAAGNWRVGSPDGAVPATAPGAGDGVVLSDVTQSGLENGVISGAGVSAALSLAAEGVLSGAFATGSLMQTVVASSFTNEVAAGATLTAQVAGLQGRLIVEGDGAVFAVAGQVTMSLPGGSAFRTPEIDAFDHAVVRLGGVAGAVRVRVDATASFEVGSAGNPAAGFLTVDAGAVIAGGLLTDAAIRNSGTIVDAQALDGPIVNDGSIVGGQTINGDISGTGRIQLLPGTLAINGQVGAGQTIDFLGAGATLALTADSAPGLITQFGLADRLDITGPAIDSAQWSAGAGGIGTLTLSADGAVVDTLSLLGDYGGKLFLVNPDGHSGTDIVLADAPGVACFAAGTRIDTPDGPVAVEALRVGGMVVNPWGETLEIGWLGHRRVDCRRHPRPWDVRPVRVRVGAFGDGLPRRDLLLSPDHAVHAGDVLIPVRYLLNGATVVQKDVAAVTYWHVELVRHDIVLAEGLPVESFLDTGNRGAFENGGPVVLHPDFARDAWDTMACAPLVAAGPIVEAVRARLLERTTVCGFGITADAGPGLLAGGRLIRPEHCASGLLRFVLPAGTELVRLVSRSVVPAQMAVAHADHRRLGLAVTALGLGLGLDCVALALDDPRLGAGWHAAEAGLRWTDGDAAIATGGAGVLAVQAAPLLCYWQEVSAPVLAGAVNRG